jgi:hypothetical protein
MIMLYYKCYIPYSFEGITMPAKSIRKSYFDISDPSRVRIVEDGTEYYFEGEFRVMNPKNPSDCAILDSTEGWICLNVMKEATELTVKTSMALRSPIGEIVTFDTPVTFDMDGKPRTYLGVSDAIAVQMRGLGNYHYSIADLFRVRGK